MDTHPKPNGWGKDKLSEFFDVAHGNEFATFDNKKADIKLLIKIDDILHNLGENLINTKSIVPAFLYLRSHSAFRAAARMSWSGQVAESFVLDRSCLEYALYALHIEKNPGSENIWSNRSNDLESKKACRTEFTYKNILNTLRNVDRPLAETANSLYEGTIDFGGHPNEAAVYSALKIHKTDRGFELVQLYLVGDSLALEHGLKIVTRVGVCSLYILRLVWKERFDILGITSELEEIQRSL